MPLPKLWSLIVHDGKLYVKSGGDIQFKFGPIVKVQTHRDKPTSIKAKFLLQMDKPRLLSLNAFSWDANPLCNRFQSCNDNEGFVEVWKKYIDPYLQKDTGKFSAEPDELSSTQAMDTEFSSLQPASSTPPPPPPPPGRAKRKSVSTPSLTPASKSARVEQDEKMDTETTSFDEEGMDKTIQENFLGFYTLPVKSLIEPPPELLLREKSEKFVESLKREMLDNPTADVQPILCMVRLRSAERFDPNLKEAYVYNTIGGNNSREAVQQLLKEHPELEEQKVFTHRLCAVYNHMGTTLALRMASKHNRATAFLHEMTTWDKVFQCRKLLYDLAQLPYSEESDPPEKPSGWKRACAVVLSQKVEQLDDALIFFLATLPCNSFKVARSIFQMYSNGKVKGQKVPKSKKNVQAKPLDLKGSNFRCLRGVAEDAVHSLLVDVKNRKLSLQELSSQCQSMKQLSRIQAGFMKATNCSSWDEAEEKYPKFVSPEQLEPFKKLSFTGSTLPEPFMKFCQTAMKSTSALPTATAVREDAHDDVFVIPHGSELGIFWKMDVFAVNGDHLDKVLKKGEQFTGRMNFPGFSLAIFDLPDGKTSDSWNTKCWSSEESKKLTMLVRALNFNVGLQQYTVALVTELEEVASVCRILREEESHVQAAVFGFKATARGRASTPKALDDNAHGLVLLRCGGESMLNDHASNIFLYDSEPLYVDEGTHKPLNYTQKPVAFLSRLIQLFTSPGDWVLDGLSGTGSTLIAALESKRNCLAIENDGVQFIHSKTRCVTIFGRNEKQETQVEKEKEGEKEEEELEDPEVDSDDLYDRDHMPEDDAETH